MVTVNPYCKRSMIAAYYADQWLRLISLVQRPTATWQWSVLINFLNEPDELLQCQCHDDSTINITIHYQYLSSSRQHYEIDDCLEDNREDYQNCHYSYICTPNNGKCLQFYV